jgi:hypothetical protein
LAEAQSAVWSEIQEVSDSLGSHSMTGALDSVYEDRRGEMERWLEAFPCLPHQVGLLAFLGARPLGMDALGAPVHYGTLHRRILSGYVLDAMDAQSLDASGQRGERKGGASVQSSEAEEFVEKMKGARRTPSESVGSGEYSILDGPVLGSELVESRHLVHLSAFPNLDGTMDSGGRPAGAPETPIARPSHRRGRY